MSDNAQDDAGDIGVGPHPRPWPDDERLDPELLAAGDRRNVVDRFRYWRTEAIRDELDRDPIAVELAVENWEHDFNIGTVVRNANAFGVRHVHIVGRRRWNRRGAMVTDRYLHVHHHPTVDSLVAHADQRSLALIGIENSAGALAIETHPLPERSLIVLGSEGPGLSPEMLEAVQSCRVITMYGSTRSLNAGVASGVALHSWHLHHTSGVPMEPERR